jgi:hypothetical protein
MNKTPLASKKYAIQKSTIVNGESIEDEKEDFSQIEVYFSFSDADGIIYGDKNENLLMTIKESTFIMILFMISSFSFSQSKYEGDALATHLGKSTESGEVKGIINNYHCDMGNPNHCISNEGLELIMGNNSLKEIHLYKASPAFGSFKSRLPQGLKFGMSPEQVRSLLGKPLVSYSNGYSEYELSDYTLSCWFDKGRLSQLNIATR